MLEGGSISFVACSRWLESEAKRSALLKGQKITSIPNPIDTHIYKRGVKDEARKRLGLPLDKRLILFASQRVTTENKGMRYLIDACRQLLTEGQTQCAVVILGGHAEEVVAQLPMEAYPLGYVNDEKRIVEVYQAVDVFVLPSLSENLPNTIMEAMACGVPTVCFDFLCGPRDIIANGINGIIVPEGDLQALATAMQQLMEHPEQLAHLSEQAKRISEEFSQEVIMERWDLFMNDQIRKK